LHVLLHCEPLCFAQFLCNGARKVAKARASRWALAPLAGDAQVAAKLPLGDGPALFGFVRQLPVA
jgi:hypothetical protein